MTISSLIKSISKKEWQCIALITLAVIVITGAPYIYGYLTAPDNAVYTGIHHLAPGDTNVFLSMIEQVRQGENIFINLYTSEFQNRIFINPLWLSVGWLGKIFNLPNLLALHLARSLWIVIFIFVVYLFLSFYFKNKTKRLGALLLLVFASGLGVFFNPFLFDVNNIYEHPTDIWVSESITFLTLYHSPHLIASLTLIVLIFLLMLLAFQNNKWKYSIGAGVTALFLFWFHPFHGPTIYMVLGLHLLYLFFRNRKITWQQIKHYLLLIIIPAPIILYLYLLSRADWVISNWAAQNILPSPTVLMYLIGYGFLLMLAIFGVWITKKLKDDRIVFLLIWVVVSAILLYVPVAWQRRMSEGLHIPIVILAAYAIFHIHKKLRLRKELYAISWLIILIVFLPLTNAQIVGQDFYLYQTKKTLPYYLYSEEVEAMQWLKQNSTINEIIYSSYYMGNYIPAYSGRVVWIGHGPQTIDLPDKKIINDWFWQSDTSIDAKYSFLKSNEIDYIFYGRKEKEIGDFNPSTKEYLEEAYKNGEVVIYRVL